jgi:hypothetical protein
MLRRRHGSRDAPKTYIDVGRTHPPLRFRQAGVVKKEDALCNGFKADGTRGRSDWRCPVAAALFRGDAAQFLALEGGTQ